MSTSELAVEGHGPSEDKGEGAESDARRDPNQSDAGELCGRHGGPFPREKEPMGGVMSLLKEATKGGEDDEKPGTNSGSASGHAAKTLPASSASSSSTSGRAKMSVSGPGNKPFPSSSSSSSSSPAPTAAPPAA
ncbi:hypothetical protein SKAU_G00406120 [Synaphobranchus kaupii]|uniref:Uncharacterized protein n=1 Tax=Synaphobranchus kaupii TaxID=118154 RepID=A0A9Q1EA23_SYNKA|nr:hypothetical protein SKAU_G00406120 [Synaphobranchus kaupii]